MGNIIIKGTGLSEYEARIKLLVLSYSVRFENIASDSLRIILKLDESAISLGNTSRSLSMSQKVQLMLDSKFFDNKDKPSIKIFLDIRNQFMHNADVKSLEICLSFLNGCENFLEKAYDKKKKANYMAGGEKAAKEKADDDANNKELLSFDINDKEKLLYKYWVSLTEDVLIAFERVLSNVIADRGLVKN